MKKKEKEAQELIVVEVEKAMNALVDSCEKIAKKWKTDSIPIETLKMAKKVFMDSYKEGARKQ